MGLIMIAAAMVVNADTGGGKGRPASPWVSRGPADAQELRQAKESARKYQTATVRTRDVAGASPGSEWIHVTEVGIQTGARELKYVLEGSTREGAQIAISLAEIETIEITRKDEGGLWVRVTKWPDVSPEELFAANPTYEQLRARYRTRVELRMEPPRGQDVVMLSNGRVHVRLRDLARGAQVDFSSARAGVFPDRFWWAIPSVIKDSQYPYRIALAA